MASARHRHTATLLPSGKVLITGGGNNTQSELASAELYDPVRGDWSPAGPMAVKRAGHTATLLASGKVLVTDGTLAELYDPNRNDWVATGPLAQPRHGYTATLLPSGKVLVAGGVRPIAYFPAEALASAEIYDPASGTWQPTGPMASPRADHTAALLTSGMVLVAGGCSRCPDYERIATAEIYDEASGAWTATGELFVARSLHAAVALPEGRAMVVGGSSSAWTEVEIYDSSSGAWSPSRVAGGHYPGGHSATVLASGAVLLFGGDAQIEFELARPVLYDPARDLWTHAAVTPGRSNHTATRLPSGQVLVAGGRHGVLRTALETAVIFDAASP